MKVQAIKQLMVNNRPPILRHLSRSVAGLALCAGLLLSSCKAQTEPLEKDVYQKEEVESVESAENVKEDSNAGVWISAILIGAIYALGFANMIVHPKDKGSFEVPYE